MAADLRAQSVSAAPWPTAYAGADLDAALEETSKACEDKLRADFKEGRARHLECDEESLRVASLLAPPTEAFFGVGRLWQITSYGMRMETKEGYACERWPLKRRRDSMLSATSAERAGCKIRPRTRPLSLVVKLDDGSRIIVEGALPAAPNGRQVWFGDVLASVSLASGVQDLRKIHRIGFGDGAWLVELDVRALFQGLTDRAAGWSVRGWATPQLFGALVYEHPFSYGAAMLSLERLMVRQGRDFAEVVSGGLSAQTFLLRHTWSPYLVAVRRHIGVWSSVGAARGRPSSASGDIPLDDAVRSDALVP
jgi:hypothetical protein